MKLSIVINVDTRDESNVADKMFSGVVNEDFITDATFNKVRFFKDIDHEVIVYVDQHNEISEQALSYLRKLCDVVVIRKHTNEPSFNCYNYMRALSMASGEYVCHIDQDTAMFNAGNGYVEELISHLENHKFVSYPSHWTPKPVNDESFGIRTWASTRFFLCKKETLKFDVLNNCLKDAEWAYTNFGDSPRRCNWLEHFLTLTNENSCYYPPIEPDKGLIFSWASYEKYTLRRLNELPYQEVVDWVISKGGIQYPVDVRV